MGQTKPIGCGPVIDPKLNTVNKGGKKCGLKPGQVVVIGLNHDKPDSFAVVPLVRLKPGCKFTVSALQCAEWTGAGACAGGVFLSAASQPGAWPGSGGRE